MKSMKFLISILCAMALAFVIVPVFAQGAAPPQEGVIGSVFPMATQGPLTVSMPQMESTVKATVSAQKNLILQRSLWLTFLSSIALIAVAELKKITKAIQRYCENVVTISGQIEEGILQKPGENPPAAAAAPPEKPSALRPSLAG